MNTFIDTIGYFLFITAELTVLFLAISTTVALVLMYVPQEKISRWMAGKGIAGNFVGALVGALTPFCACSTIPLTLGFLGMGISFGTVMSFVIASPLMNPIIFSIMLALMGLKTSLVYLAVTFAGAVVFGVVLEKIGGEKCVKAVRINGCCGQSNEPVPELFSAKFKIAFFRAWEDFRGVLLYLLIGVGIGAAIYGYLPQDFVLQVAGPDNLFAVPVAAVIGIPLYIRAETAIPIGVALMGKGMSVGAVIALIIGGAGMAIPEMSMLAGIFKKKLVAAIVIVVFLTAVAGGYFQHDRLNSPYRIRICLRPFDKSVVFIYGSKIMGGMRMNTLNDTQIPQSNTILFNGVPIEEIQNIKVSKNYCGSCTDLRGTDTYWAWKKQSLRQQ